MSSRYKQSCCLLTTTSALMALLCLCLLPSASAAEDECFEGEYVVSRSTIEEKNVKALQEVAKASARPVSLVDESDRVFLVKDSAVKGALTAGEKRIVKKSQSVLCSRLQQRLRQQRAANAGIVRRIECSCNAVMRAVVTPNDPLFYSQWGMHQSNGIDMNLPEAWELTVGSPDTVVAVIDTGVDYDHADLRDNMWRNPGEIPDNGIDDDQNGYIDDVYGINAINNSGDPFDDNGHGTHVAGVIGAAGNNAIGLAGINWDIRMIAVKFLNSSGWGSLFDAVKAVDYVTALKQRGVNVVLSNNSWAGGGFYASLDSAIGRAADAGILFVAAAGNDAMNIDSNPMYPASYQRPNIISVAAIDSSGNLAYFSNYGAASVDIAAPGVSIPSTYPYSRYTWMSGTSMATPHVSGALALLSSYAPAMSWQELRDSLYANGTPLATLVGLVATAKIVNMSAMLQSAGSPVPPPTPTPTPPPVLRLHSAGITGSNLTISYSKDFEGCAHIWKFSAAGWSKTAHQNFLCASGVEISKTVDMTLAFAAPLAGGDTIKLCSSSDQTLCSASLSVDYTEPPTPTPTPTPALYDVSGKTVDEKGRAISGVRVSLVLGTEVRMAATGPDGVFSFNDVQGPSDYTLTASKAGYEFTFKEGYLTEDLTATLTGKQKTFTVRGVIMTDSSPIAGALVDGGPFGMATTNSNGAFSFTVPYGAEYALAVTVADYHFERNFLSGVVLGDVDRLIIASPD